jgi:predicted RecA/RadA family phage recombinase
MAKTFVQTGDVLTIAAPAAVVSGAVVQAGSIIGIAQGNAAIGEKVDVACGGVWTLPKVASEAYAGAGVPVYYNSGNGLVTSTASGNTKLGVAVESVAASVGTVKVRLSGAF